MTLKEIVVELDRLKDYTNDTGRGMIHGIQAALKPSVMPPIVEKPVIVPAVAEGDRREEPRDPSEHEQHVAEDLGLTPRPK